MIRRFIEGLKEPIVLSHHPLCGRFDNHVFEIKGRKVCRGCITAYPVAIISLIIILIFRPFSYDILFISSVVAFIINLGRFLIKRNVATDIIFNSLLGISLAAVVTSALTAPPEMRTIIAAIAVFTFIAFNLFKGYRMFSTCRSCPHSSQFPDCSVKSNEMDDINKIDSLTSIED